jgi:hypothetical protein
MNTQNFFILAIAFGRISVTKAGVITNEETGKVFGGQRSRYKTVALLDRRTGRKRAILAHRLVWIRFNGPIPEGMEINHKDGVKHNNRLSNLELVTSSKNKLHAFKLGLRKKLSGEQVGAAVFCSKEVRKLRAEWKKSGLSMRAFWKLKDKKGSYATRQTIQGRIAKGKE